MSDLIIINQEKKIFPTRCAFVLCRLPPPSCSIWLRVSEREEFLISRLAFVSMSFSYF